ncbi:MAG: aminotransferase class V-fold PLP-dependent enzyme, partial [Sphaerochaetaceae bacterium]
MKLHYFDWAATAPISEQALYTYHKVAKEYPGNPSSLHKEGQRSAKRLAAEREKTADLLQVAPEQIYYTAGGTESNSIVLNSLLWKRKPGRIIFSGLEHSSILQYRHFLETKGFEVISIRSPGGFVDIEALQENLTDNTQLVCVMLVNNILGTVQDLTSIAKILRQRAKPIHLHCDAVQAVGKISFNLSDLDVDSASFSAHKFQGPRGTGILYQKSNTLQSLSRGGGQEQGLRSGTEHL